MEILIVIIAALISGIVSIVISNRYYQRNENRRLKINVLQQLIGNRHDFKGDKCTEALNQIAVVFCDSDDVIQAYKTFFKSVSSGSPNNNSEFIDLCKSICKHLNVTSPLLNDDVFLQVFNLRQRTQVASNVVKR